MTDEELKHLEQRFLSGETTLDEEAQLAKALRNRICTTDDELALKSMLAWMDKGMPTDKMPQINSTEKSSTSTHKRKSLIKRLAISAAAVIAILLIAITSQNGNENLTADNKKVIDMKSPKIVYNNPKETIDTLKAKPSDNKKNKKKRKAIFRIVPPKVYLAQQMSDSTRQAAEQRLDAMLAEMRMKEIEIMENINYDIEAKNEEIDEYLATFIIENEDDCEYTLY